MTATAPDGSAIQSEERNTEVVRQQSDGRWLFVIDNSSVPQEPSPRAIMPVRKWCKRTYAAPRVVPHALTISAAGNRPSSGQHGECLRGRP
jgi:hypothetical protein